MILPSQSIRRLISEGHITAGKSIASRQVQPASLDLRLSNVLFRSRASFLPGGKEASRKLGKYASRDTLTEYGSILEPGCVYVVQLLEQLVLPEGVSAICNPKSSTGRLDVFVRVIADGGDRFDVIPAGYEGPLYIEVCPQSFPIRVRQGSTLAQIRFARWDDNTLPWRDSVKTTEAISVDLPTTGVVGYRARRHTGVIDVDAVGACNIADFWEPITAPDGRLILDPDEFYILASRETVDVDTLHAAELAPFDATRGEFRLHYAGFCDPGFRGRVVLEVRSHKTPFVLEDGQAVGTFTYERLTEAPDCLYGADIGSNYQAQGLKLSKHFR